MLSVEASLFPSQQKSKLTMQWTIVEIDNTKKMLNWTHRLDMRNEKKRTQQGQNSH